MTKRLIVKDWTPIESAPEGRIIQVVRYVGGKTCPAPSLAIRRVQSGYHEVKFLKPSADCHCETVERVLTARPSGSGQGTALSIGD